MIGTRLGPYEITAKLGEGGMGEVFLATDTRLGREVAIKVLPAELAGDADRLRRFEQEAKAVSALSHPNIVTLYETGTSEAGPYLVLERVEGKSLREIVRRGPVPLRRLLKLAAEIAEGLAKAHSVGIVHRDLKPENVMVTTDGYAKILDFGLAKLVWPELEDGAAGEATTLAGPTGTGMILGTPGYLSPEQAAGRPADFRADQFALGALIYELATGERPFHGTTTGESLAAVQRDEPEPLAARIPSLPPQLGWVVERCLAKDPEERYASTRDLARDLADLRDHYSDIVRAGPSAGSGRERERWSRRRLVWAAAAAAAIVIAIVVSSQLVPRTATAEPPSFRPLTFQRGVLTGARFSPDGETVYYSAAWGAEPSRIFFTRLESTESVALDLPPAVLLSVSRKGELAVLLTEDRSQNSSLGTLARVPALGGTPRELVEGAVDADWTPDGEQLAVVLDRREFRLEFPAGHDLGQREVFMPRISPRGDRIAWLRTGIEVADLEGKRMLHHPFPFVFGLAWSPDGREVWFTGSESGSGTDRALYSLTLTGERRMVARVPGALTILDITSDGKSALLATGAGWFGVSFVHRGEDRETTLDLFGRTSIVDLSADGKWLLMTEQREVGRGVYLRSTDGAQTVRLGDGEPLALSPDGEWALIARGADAAHSLTLVPTGPGVARELPLASGSGPQLPERLGVLLSVSRWSPDGRRLFVPMRSADDDGSARIYLREGERPWRPVTPPGVAGQFAVSPDGLQLAARDSAGTVTLFPVDGGDPRPLAREHGSPLHWSADGAWLYLRTGDWYPARIYRRELASGRVEPWRVVVPTDPVGVNKVREVLFAADGSSYAYSYSRVLSQELYLAEGLR